MTRRSPVDRISALDAAAQLDALARVDAYIAMITDPWSDVAVTAPLTHRDESGSRETATQVLVEPPAKVPERMPRRRGTPPHARGLLTGVAAIALVAGLIAGAAWLVSPAPVKGAISSHQKSHTIVAPTTSSVATSTTATTATPASSAVTSAASALDAAIVAGENNATVSVAAGQSLIRDVNPLLTPTVPSSTQAQQLNQVVQQFQVDVQGAQVVTGATIGSLTTSINTLATALGSSVAVMRPTGPSGFPAPGGPGHGHGHGHGH
jgi:hypothetical protein